MEKASTESSKVRSGAESKNLNVDEHATPIVKPRSNKNNLNPEKVEELETENLILRRQMPHLKDTEGKDVTNEFLLLREKLAKAERERDDAKAEVVYYKKQMHQMGVKDPRLSDTMYEPSLISEFENGNGDIPKMSMPADFQLHDDEKRDLLKRMEELEKELEEQRLLNAKKDKVIGHFSKICPIDANMTGVEMSDKEVWLKRLFTDLKSINKEWRTLYPELKEAIKNFVDANGCDRPSLFCERMDEERKVLEKEVNAMDSFANISQQQLSVSFQPQVVVDAFAAMDLLANGSITPNDLEEYQNVLNTYKRVCTGMFDQLQQTATFLKKLTDSLESSEDEPAKKLLKKIQELQLRMNTSMDEAKIAMDEVSKTEQSICMILERSMQTSFANVSIVAKENIEIEVLQKEVHRLREFEVQAGKITGLEEEIRRLKDLEPEILNLEETKQAAVSKVAELEKKVQELQKIESEIEVMKKYKIDAEKVPTLQSQIEKLKQYEVEAKKVPHLETKISKLQLLEKEMERLAELEKKAAETSEKDEEIARCRERIEYLENVLNEKESEVQKLADENKEPLKKFVPSIVDEMNKIYNVLESVTTECKKITTSQKHSKPKHP